MDLMAIAKKVDGEVVGGCVVATVDGKKVYIVDRLNGQPNLTDVGLRRIHAYDTNRVGKDGQYRADAVRTGAVNPEWGDEYRKDELVDGRTKYRDAENPAPGTATDIGTTPSFKSVVDGQVTKTGGDRIEETRDERTEETRGVARQPAHVPVHPHVAGGAHEVHVASTEDDLDQALRDAEQKKNK